jgi:hypothetical protein
MHFINSTRDWLIENRPQIPALGRLVFAVLVSTSLLHGYTVLTHEAIIDSVWDTTLKETAAETIPRRDARGVGAGARLRVWGLHHSGHGILSFQQPPFQ